MASEGQKVTVTLPKALLERLNETVPARRRSYFIAEAVREQLEIVEQTAALEETAGAWTLENHPEMKDDEDIDAWLRAFRRGQG